jgi:NAD+ kinase
VISSKLHPALTVSTKTFMNTDGTKEIQPVVCHVLNEISVTRGSAEFMMLIDVYVNDVHLTTVQGDGVLISTPTGSTAYNMSCGGSIVHASAQVICVTPICPHSLSFRPLILPIDAKITLVLPSETRTDAWVTFDG